MISGRNPYIHGTVSSVLDFLPLTDFQFMSPLTMIEKYGIAPESGELTGGGFDSVRSDCYPCFGRARCEGRNHYGLDKVLRYTSPVVSDPIKSLKDEVAYPRMCGYSNLTLVIIFMARCQQSGYNVKSIVTDEFIADARAIRNALSLVLFLDKWVRPCQDISQDQDKCDAIYTNLTLGNIADKLKSFEIDLFAVYNAYCDSPDDLPDQIKSAILSSLEVPCISIEHDGEVDLGPTQFFTSDPIPCHSHRSPFSPSYLVYRMSQNAPGFSIADLLEYYSRSKLSDDFFPKLRQHMIPLLTDFEHRINLLQTLRDRHDIPRIPHSLPVFPLVLVSQDDTVMKNLGSEYRSIRPLTLGVDITILATDTPAHKIILHDYLDKNGITCDVILFSDLK